LQSIFTREELFMGINHLCSPFTDVLMTGFTYLADGIVFGLLLLYLLVARKFRPFLIGLTTVLTETIIVQVLKRTIDAPRPLGYFQDPSLLHLVKWMPAHYNHSFPSGHAACAFALFCYLALIDNNKIRGVLFMGMALAAAYSRVYLAQHFFQDIYVGSIIGASTSFVVYSLFEYRNLTKTPEICPRAALETETALLAEV